MNDIQGILLKIASTIMFTLMITLAKLLSESVPLGEIIFARSLFGLVPVLVYLLIRRQFPHGLKTKKLGAHLTRAVIGVSSMALWFAALGRLPLPDAQAINYASPLIAVILAAVLLGESVRIHRWTAVVVGLIGVLVVLSEHIGGGFGAAGSEEALGALLALGSAFFTALAMMHVRRLTATETTGSIVFYMTATAGVLALLTLPFGWVVPTPYEALLLVSMGLFGGIGQVFMTEGYARAEASILAPFDYSNMVWVILIGIFVFGDVPTLTVLLGSAIVVGAGIFVVLRERYLTRQRARAIKAPKLRGPNGV